MIGKDEIKIRLKQATQGLESGMLQPANCILESFKTWQACIRFRQGFHWTTARGKKECL